MIPIYTISMMLFFLAVISLLYPLNTRIANKIGEKRNFLTEDSLKTLSRVKYRNSYLVAYKALSSFDINVFLAVLILIQIIGKLWTLALIGIAALISTLWDTALTSLTLSSDVRGCYRVLRFTRSGAILSAIYVILGFLWLLVMFCSLSFLINDADMFVRLFFIIFLVIILDWAMATFNYGYWILGFVVIVASFYYLEFPLKFLSPFASSPQYSLIALMLGIPFLLLYHLKIIERRPGLEGRAEKESSLILFPTVVLLSFLGLLLWEGKLPTIASDPFPEFKMAMLIIALLVLFLPFPRVSFSIHHSLKTSSKIEGKRISKWTTGTSLVFFSVCSFLALIFSNYLSENSLLGILSQGYLPMVLISLSILSIGSIFTFSYEGLEFLSQRIPEGKGGIEVVKMIFISYYVAIPIILATLGFQHFYSVTYGIYFLVIPTLASFFVFAFTVRRKKVEERSFSSLVSHLHLHNNWGVVRQEKSQKNGIN